LFDDAMRGTLAKILLLHEFKLSPAILLEKFNTLNRVNPETYTIYANRLKSVLSHYVEARKAAKYEVLLELLVSDRIKAKLSESALRHILSLETAVDGNWLRLSQLTSALDLFYDSHMSNDKPRYVTTAVSSYGSKADTPSRVNSPRPTPPGNAKVFNRGNSHERRCYTCGSKNHLQNFHSVSKTRYNAPKKINALSAVGENAFDNVVPTDAINSEPIDTSLPLAREANESVAVSATIMYVSQTLMIIVLQCRQWLIVTLKCV
jgi:hypothetical protein